MVTSEVFQMEEAEAYFYFGPKPFSATILIVGLWGYMRLGNTDLGDRRLKTKFKSRGSCVCHIWMSN